MISYEADLRKKAHLSSTGLWAEHELEAEHVSRLSTHLAPQPDAGVERGRGKRRGGKN